MRTQELNRTDAERLVGIIKNVDGSGSVTTGLGVGFPGSGASIDGVGAVKLTAANIRGFMGVAEEDIPINGFGRVCMSGFTNSVSFSNVGTSITVTAGDTLKIGAVAGTWFSSLTDAAFTTVFYKYVVACDSVTISALSYTRGIVRGAV